jgi:hypothetical protein
MPLGKRAGKSDAEWRQAWLDVIGYEVWMLGETYKMQVVQVPLFITQAVQNAITESGVLHARNLCNFCAGPWQNDDIKPSDLFENHYISWEYIWLQKLIGDVATTYNGAAVDGKSPRWAFNKKLAHPTQDRGLGFNYEPFLKLVYPKIKLLAEEIGRLEKKEQGRDFPSLPDISF